MRQRVVHQVADGQPQQQRVALHGERWLGQQGQVVPAGQGGFGPLGQHLLRHHAQVHRLGRGGQRGAAGAGQRQQFRQHLAGAQGVLLQALQCGRAGAGRCLAQRTRLQHQGRQRRAQLMRQLAGQFTFTFQRPVVALHQGVDGPHHGGEFGRRVRAVQALAVTLVHLQRLHVVRQGLQRLQPASQRQPQGQCQRRQQPQAGRGHLAGDVPAQLGALGLVDQHHHPPRRRPGRPARKAAPGLRRRAQLQRGKALATGKRRQRRGALVGQQAALGVPHHQAHGLLVGMLHRQVHIGGVRGGAWLPVPAGGQQRGHAGQVAVDQLVGLVAAGLVPRHDEAQPQQRQRAQAPGQQVAEQRRAAALHRPAPGAAGSARQ